MLTKGLNLHDLQKAKDNAYQEICTATGLTAEQVKPAVEKYEQRLQNLVAQYHAGARKAAARLQQDIEAMTKESEESSNGLGQ